MLKQLLAFTLSIHFLLGALVLPNSSFDAISNLPQMYHHCQAYEDKDMDIFDFVTDHLINIDGFFDAHGKGDEQMPHRSFPFQMGVQHIMAIIFDTSSTIQLSCYSKNIEQSVTPYQMSYSNACSQSIFHPPKA